MNCQICSNEPNLILFLTDQPISSGFDREFKGRLRS